LPVCHTRLYSAWHQSLVSIGARGGSNSSDVAKWVLSLGPESKSIQSAYNGFVELALDITEWESLTSEEIEETLSNLSGCTLLKVQRGMIIKHIKNGAGMSFLSVLRMTVLVALFVCWCLCLNSSPGN
jgi:hypothetical protein